MSLVTNLVHKYGDFTLEIPEWEILDRGVTVLWGPSGSGKTTLFRHLIGLESAPGMKWMFQGEDLAALPAPRRRVGVVFQTLELFPHMTARQNILFAAEARKIDKDVAEEACEKLCKQMALESCLHRKAHVLSGGERQRVALARAIIARPRILFLDEPFSALDADLRGEARRLVNSVIASQNIPAVLITHDREDLQFVNGKITEIGHGKIQRETLHSSQQG